VPVPVVLAVAVAEGVASWVPEKDGVGEDVPVCVELAELEAV